MGSKQKCIFGSFWGIQSIFLLFFLGIAFWTAGQTGILSDIGREDVYWERARFLLGQRGVSGYTGSSVCSLGYSLILVPVCALAKSPYAAYKAAILLNAIFLCLAYLTATKAARELFSDENEAFLYIACFFAVFCPALAAAEIYTGPEMAVLFLMWLSVYSIVVIWKGLSGKRQGPYCRNYLFLLAVCMILIAFLQITALGVILAVIAWLACYVREKRLNGNTFLAFVLIIFLGLAAGNIAERIFLYRFSMGVDISVFYSSLETVLKEAFQRLEADSLLQLLNSLAGKLYSSMIGSFLLICPAIWSFFRNMFCKAVRTEIDNQEEEDKRKFPVNGITGIFFAQLLWMSLCDQGGSAESTILSVSGLELVLSPVIFLGIVRFKQMDEPTKELSGYLLALFILALLVAGVFQNADVDAITGTRCGLFTVLRINGDLMKPVAAIGLSVCLVSLTVIVFFCCFVADPERNVI